MHRLKPRADIQRLRARIVRLETHLDAPGAGIEQPRDADCLQVLGRQPSRRSRTISRAALCPGAPVTPPPGCAPEPQWYSPLSGPR